MNHLNIEVPMIAAVNGPAVHATTQRLDQLLQTASSLGSAGVAEQARWATIQAFAPIPEDHRVDRCFEDYYGHFGDHRLFRPVT